MVLIHEKITALLEQRRLKKRDLARALNVSPQTATDICKGRSAITLPHLRNLITFFEVRAEFWLDDERLVPEDVDRLSARGTQAAIARTGLLQVQDPEKLLRRVRTFVQQNRAHFLASFPDLTPAERRVLGFAEVEKAWAEAATKQYAEFQQTLRSSPVVQRAFVAVIVTQLIVLLWYQIGVPALVYLAGQPWPSAGATVEWAYLLLALCLGGGAYVFREPPDLTKLLK